MSSDEDWKRFLVLAENNHGELEEVERFSDIDDAEEELLMQRASGKTARLIAETLKK